MNPESQPASVSAEIVMGWLAVIKSSEIGYYFSPTIWADRYEAYRIYGDKIHSFVKVTTYTGEGL